MAFQPPTVVHSALRPSATASTSLCTTSFTSTSSRTGPLAARLPLRIAAGAAHLRGTAAPTSASASVSSAADAGYVDTTRPRVIIVTGASSSIGFAATRYLTERPDVHVVMAVRNPEKAAAAAKQAGLKPGSYTVRCVDLASLDSVRSFVAALQQEPAYRNFSGLVCNAATWHPRDKKARTTVDGYDETVQVNHLAHFLLINLLLPRLKAARARVVFLATATHNPDTIAGKVPPQANLGDLHGMATGFKAGTGTGTIDGLAFEPTKAYKDSKVCNILTMTELHRRFAADGVVASAVFPGCVAASELFREKRGWFRWFFPIFQRYVTRQYVDVDEAGRRVSLLAADPRFGDSGKYWQWTGSYLDGTADTNPTPIQPTEREAPKAERLWQLSADLVGLA